MQVVQARATFVTPETFDESLTTIVARSVLEAALAEDESAELWFELGTEDGEDVNRLSIDLSSTDIEQLLRLSSEDEIALTLDGEGVENLFGEPDVEGHGLKGAIAIAVTSAAILAPASQAAVPQATASATQQSKIQATAQVAPAATAQVSSLAARVQVASQQAKAQVAKGQVAKVSGLKLLRSGLAR